VITQNVLSVLRLFFGNEFEISWMTISLCQCVVPENVHTPTTEGIGNAEGVGWSKTQKFWRGGGVEQLIWFPDAI